MHTEIPAVVERYLAAYAALDVDAMLSTVTEDVVFENLSNASPPLKTEGKAQLEALARQSVTLFSARKQTVIEAVVDGARVALRVSFEAVVAQDLPNGWKRGQALELIGASFIELRAERISRIVDLS
jgi:ketosteroid isomerase-like protein